MSKGATRQVLPMIVGALASLTVIYLSTGIVSGGVVSNLRGDAEQEQVTELADKMNAYCEQVKQGNAPDDAGESISMGEISSFEIEGQTLVANLENDNTVTAELDGGCEFNFDPDPSKEDGNRWDLTFQNQGSGDTPVVEVEGEVAS